MVDVGGRNALFISGTASIVGHKTMHIGDVRQQTKESLTNIAAILDVAATRVDAGAAAFAASDLVCTVYVREAADLPVVREVFEQVVGPSSPAAREAIYLHADICRADLLVEIEAHGFAPIGSTP
jgi:enamine deaminase RidA (YjgF/YER057c/UK114 family)